MDELLSELYGTAETIGGEEDVEKTAAAEFLVKLAAEEGIDLNELSDEEVSGLLEEVEKTAGAEGGLEEPEDEAQEKLGEADFLGRAMAHAYVNELSEIEKGAAFQKAPMFQRMAKAVTKAVKGSPERYRKAGRSLKRSVVGGEGAVKKRKLLTRVKDIGKGLKGVAPEAGALGAAGGATYLATKDKKSFNESFESAAKERAYEMLADAGYDVEKVAQADVDQRALQMLADAGYQMQE